MNPQLTGAAGVFHVAAELSFRGMVALPSIRNTKGADVLVSNTAGTRFALIQVKTSKSKVGFWPGVSRTWIGKNCWYVFVRRTDDQFECFMVKAAEAALEARKSESKVKAAGRKAWVRSWTMRGRYAASRSAEKRARRQWLKFDLSES